MKISLSEILTELALITLFSLGLSFFVYVVSDAYVVACEVDRIRSLY